MKLNSQAVLKELTEMTRDHLSFLDSIKNLPETELQKKPSSSSWSVIECLEHLNRYATHYYSQFKNALEKSNSKTTLHYKTSYLGNKFAGDMLPSDTMKTMNTFKSKNPIYSEIDSNEVLTNFNDFQHQLLNILKKAENKNLQKIKIKTTIPLLSFNLGDALRFVIYHNERHIVQATKIAKNANRL